VDALRRFYNDQAIGVGRITLLFIVNFIALLQINVRLTLLSVIAVPFILATSVIFFKKVSKAYEAYQEQDAVLSTTLQENLSGVRVVKAFARDARDPKIRPQQLGKFPRQKLLTIHSLFWPVGYLRGARLLGVVPAGAMMAIRGELSIGSYMAEPGC
jgi:ATP-binding cassette subfamily B protein